MIRNTAIPASTKSWIIEFMGNLGSFISGHGKPLPGGDGLDLR
jgi:hypothetical protein